MEFVDLILDRIKDQHPLVLTYKMDGNDTTISLGFGQWLIRTDKDGSVCIYPNSSRWIRIGNIHEPDVIDRLDQLLKRIL